MNGAQEMVVLVDENDNRLGLEEKLKAHQNGGKLHRAISIFVFNSGKEIMLQRRSLAKYHAGGLWANTCCSHPRDGEPVEAAGHRRLMEEMGFDCGLKEAFSFIYHADVGNGLRENEYDHVLVGRYDLPPKPNPAEVSGWKFMGLEGLSEDIRANPDAYAPWLRIALPRMMGWAGENL